MKCRASLVACFGILIQLVYAQSDDSTSDMLQQYLMDAIEANMGYGSGILRMQYANGTVFWQGATGERVNTSSTETQPSDSFEVASVTKSFTSTIILQLAEEGKIDLDAPITQYTTPPGVMDDAQGTVRQVLQHYAGLPDYWTDPPYIGNPADENNAFLVAFNANETRIWQHFEMPEYAANLTIIAKPGTEFHYDDTGYVLSGLIIENVTGLSFNENIQQRICQPLGMNNTFMRDWLPNATAISNFAHRYEDSLDISVLPRQSADWAGGGLVSTAEDLATFIFALSQGKPFQNASTLAEMQNWLPTGQDDVDYGLGLYRISLGQYGELWGHDGHCNSFMYFWPQANLTFTGTLNQESNDWFPLVSNATNYVP